MAAWHEARAQRYAEIIRAEVGDGGTIGFLVWGDPAFYDSTIRIVQSIADLELILILRLSQASAASNCSPRGTRSS